MDSNPREMPSELEIRMRRNAPKLPPNLRQKTLEACAKQAVQPTMPAPIPVTTPAQPAAARWSQDRGQRQKRQKWYLMGICAAQLTAASLLVIKSATMAAAGDQTMTASLSAGIANIVSLFTGIFK